MILYFNKEKSENKLLFDSAFYSLLRTIVSYFPPTKIKSKSFIKNEKNLKVKLKKTGAGNQL